MKYVLGELKDIEVIVLFLKKNSLSIFLSLSHFFSLVGGVIQDLTITGERDF